MAATKKVTSRQTLSRLFHLVHLVDHTPFLGTKKWLGAQKRGVIPIGQMLTNFSESNSKRTVSKYRKRKRQSLPSVHVLFKTWNLAFSRRSRAQHAGTAKKCTKNVHLNSSHEVWVKVTCDWSTALCLSSAYVDPVFTIQSYDISISINTSTRSTVPNRPIRSNQR